MKNPGSFLRFAAKLAVSAGLLAFLVNKISVGNILSLVRQMNPGVAAAAIVVFFSSNLLGATQWHLLLASDGIRLPFSRSFQFYFVGLFFNNFLPANVGGDAVKVYDVSRAGGGVYRVVAVTLLDRIIGIFSLCLLAAAVVVVLVPVNPVPSLGWYLLVFVGCMTPVLGFYFFEPMGRFLRWLIGLIRPFSVDERGTAVLDHMGHFKSRRWLVAKLIGMSLAIQALRIFTHVLVAVSLGIQVDAVTGALFFVYVPLLGLAMVPPVTINGLGVREGLGILLFAHAGIGRTDAFTLEFMTYLVSVAVSLLGLFFFAVRRERAPEPVVGQTAN